MKASLFIAGSREEVARDAPWAKIIVPVPEHKDGWLACDNKEAYEYAMSDPVRFLLIDAPASR